MYSICVAHVLFRIEVDVVSCIFVHTETHRQTHRHRQTDSFRAVSVDLEAKTDEPYANRVSRFLIGSSNTQRTPVLSYWTLEHVHWTSCFDFDFDLSGEQDSVLS